MDPDIRQELVALGLNDSEISRLDALITERIAALAQQTVANEESTEGNP